MISLQQQLTGTLLLHSVVMYEQTERVSLFCSFLGVHTHIYTYILVISILCKFILYKSSLLKMSSQTKIIKEGSQY